MFKMAAAKIETEDGPCCPICLEQFSIPRQLPCAHSFCEKCLQSHITTEAGKHENMRSVKCPVCRHSSSPSIKDRPTSEWATLFPVNKVLQSILPAKLSVDHFCDACKNEDVFVPAEGFCVVCKEAMCGDCLKFHRKQKMLKDHSILSVEELDSNQENVMKLAEGFTCSEHEGEDIKYYCIDHNVPSCGTCFFEGHTAISSTRTLTCSRRPPKDCQVESVDVIDVKCTAVKRPLYTGVTFHPGDRVMLADYSNKQCILLNPSYKFITSHTLTGNPWNICALDDQEVAVSLHNQNKIQILSVIGDVIRPVRTITTKHIYNGIAAAGKGEMVVDDYCGNDKSQWSLINTRGDVKCTHQYDALYNYKNYVAVNNMKTRVYISVYSMNSVICFDMDGKKQFTYSPDNLKSPMGVAVDRFDNIYVLGYSSGNIHQLSPNGSVIQVVNTGVPKYPRAICIHKSKDILITTNESSSKKLHIYRLKYT